MINQSLNSAKLIIKEIFNIIKSNYRQIVTFCLLIHVVRETVGLTDALLVIVNDVFTDIVVRIDDSVMVTPRSVTSDAEQYAEH